MEELSIYSQLYHLVLESHPIDLSCKSKKLFQYGRNTGFEQDKILFPRVKTM